jgi:plastocyanin
MPGKTIAAIALVALSLLAGRAGDVFAADDATIPVTIKDHRFTPAEIHVKAGQPTVLRIDNQDATAEEFDSKALKVEKVIAGGHQGLVRLHPLAAGSYPFMGEYHAATAKGVVVAE